MTFYLEFLHLAVEEKVFVYERHAILLPMLHQILVEVEHL